MRVHAALGGLLACFASALVAAQDVHELSLGEAIDPNRSIGKSARNFLNIPKASSLQPRSSKGLSWERKVNHLRNCLTIYWPLLMVWVNFPCLCNFAWASRMRSRKRFRF